jgi:hypothetical protein
MLGTYDWLKEIDKIVGAVLLDFTAAFDVIDHNRLLQKRTFYGFTSPATAWIESYPNTDGVFLMDASPTSSR